MLCNIEGHTFDETRLPEKPRVLDVGAREFKFTRGILELRPQAYVLAMEPDASVPVPDDFAGVRYTALVGEGRKRAFYISNSTGEGNYVLPQNTPYDRSMGAISLVPACDIRDITDAATAEKWDLVKLDCECSEFGILENWPRGGIADQITVEFHDFTNPLRWNSEYFQWLWTQLPEYEVVQHERFKQGEAFGYWDTLLVRK